MRSGGEWPIPCQNGDQPLTVTLSPAGTLAHEGAAFPAASGRRLRGAAARTTLAERKTGLPQVDARAGADLGHVDLRGPHDLRHTFATWLEDAAIPSRVIDELMGHTSGRRDRAAGGSPMSGSTGRRPRRWWPG
jgi:integrase